MKAKAGTFIHIPRDTSHSFTIDEDPSHVLNFYFPAGFEHILLSIAAPAQSQTVPAPDAVPMPPPEFANELAREYGQTKDLGMPWVDIPDANNIVTVPSKTNPFKPFGNSVADAPRLTLIPSLVRSKHFLCKLVLLRFADLLFTEKFDSTQAVHY